MSINRSMDNMTAKELSTVIEAFGRVGESINSLPGCRASVTGNCCELEMYGQRYEVIATKPDSYVVNAIEHDPSWAEVNFVWLWDVKTDSLYSAMHAVRAMMWACYGDAHATKTLNELSGEGGN